MDTTTEKMDSSSSSPDITYLLLKEPSTPPSEAQVVHPTIISASPNSQPIKRKASVHCTSDSSLLGLVVEEHSPKKQKIEKAVSATTELRERGTLADRNHFTETETRVVLPSDLSMFIIPSTVTITMLTPRSRHSKSVHNKQLSVPEPTSSNTLEDFQNKEASNEETISSSGSDFILDKNTMLSRVNESSDTNPPSFIPCSDNHHTGSRAMEKTAQPISCTQTEPSSSSVKEHILCLPINALISSRLAVPGDSSSSVENYLTKSNKITSVDQPYSQTNGKKNCDLPANVTRIIEQGADTLMDVIQSIRIQYKRDIQNRVLALEQENESLKTQIAHLSESRERQARTLPPPPSSLPARPSQAVSFPYSSPSPSQPISNPPPPPIDDLRLSDINSNSNINLNVDVSLQHNRNLEIELRNRDREFSALQSRFHIKERNEYWMYTRIKSLESSLNALQKEKVGWDEERETLGGVVRRLKAECKGKNTGNSNSKKTGQVVSVSSTGRKEGTPRDVTYIE